LQTPSRKTDILPPAPAADGDDSERPKILLQRARSTQILTGAVKFKNLDEGSLVSRSTGARVHEAVSQRHPFGDEGSRLIAVTPPRMRRRQRKAARGGRAVTQ
jgi:hypothetical protein